MTCSHALLFVAFSAFAQQRHVIVLPAGEVAEPSSRTASILDLESWKLVGTAAVGREAFNAFTLPNGSKTYVVSKSELNTITVLNRLGGGVSVLKSINLPSGSTDAVLTPDGKRLLLVSMADAALTIINTSTDSILARIPLSAPANSVVSNYDGSMAFTASPRGAEIAAVDILRNVKSASAALPASLQANSQLAAAPGGALYIVAGTSLYEIDPRSLVATAGKVAIPTGSARLLFPIRSTQVLIATPDSAAFAPLRKSQPGGFMLRPGFDHLRLISETAAIGYSAAKRTFYRVDLNQELSLTPLPGLAALGEAPVGSIGGSDEDPTSRYVFISSGNAVYRVDAASHLITAKQQLDHVAGLAILPPTPSSAAINGVYALDALQVAPVGGTAGPLKLRALDAKGLPVAGRAVLVGGSGVASRAFYTNAQGYLEALLDLPARPGFFPIFTFSWEADIRNRPLIIAAGSSQVAGMFFPYVLEPFPGEETYLVNSGSVAGRQIVVASAAGHWMSSATVDWKIIGGGGRMAFAQTLSDSNGAAFNSFTAPVVPGPVPERTTIRVSSPGGNSADLRFITLPLSATEAPLPIFGLKRLTPSGPLSLRGVVSTRTNVTLQYQLATPGEPLAGIALTFGRGPRNLNVNCRGYSAETDDAGLVSCSIDLGAIAGQGKVPVFLGGQYVEDIDLHLAPQPPEVIRIVGGYDQAPIEDRELPLPLVAVVTDGWGNRVDGIAVNWTVDSGNVTLLAASSETAPGSYSSPRESGAIVSSGGLVSTRVYVRDLAQPIQISATPLAGFAARDIFYSRAVFALKAPQAPPPPSPPPLFTGGLSNLDGAGQTTPAGTLFARPLLIQATDRETGEAAVGVRIEFRTGAGLALSSSSAITDVWGRAEVTVVGVSVGSHAVSASTGTASTSFTLIVTPRL